MKPRVLDLFSGIGGFSLGLEAAGYETAAFCEISPKCRHLLAHHWPGVPCHDDITTLTLDTLAKHLEDGASDEERETRNMAARRKDYDEAVRMYEAGLSIGDVADFYSMTRQGMWDILRRRGCSFRPQLRYGDENHFHRGTSASGRAHDITEKAVAKGILIRPDKCEQCGGGVRMKNGRTSIQAHHGDYNKPLDVNWLCQPCHHAWHKANTAIPRKEAPQESPQIDAICGGFP